MNWLTEKEERTAYHIGQKFGENVKNQFGEIKFSKNVKIMIILAEL